MENNVQRFDMIIAQVLLLAYVIANIYLHYEGKWRLAADSWQWAPDSHWVSG